MRVGCRGSIEPEVLDLKGMSDEWVGCEGLMD